MGAFYAEISEMANPLVAIRPSWFRRQTAVPDDTFEAPRELLYWGPVVRPGDQSDMDVNGDLLAPPIVPMVGAARPAFGFEESIYWARGVNIGIEGRW